MEIQARKVRFWLVHIPNDHVRNIFIKYNYVNYFYSQYVDSVAYTPASKYC
ncbi:Uncharacterised protein [Escherichia coli]|nr:Uncharacterised protein [Escherichia coli]VWN20650.1 Uncharacterised protein [Escherichia coli]